MRKHVILFAIISALFFTGCKKYLDAKPDKKLALPESIADVQALLDNESTMNLFNQGPGEISADNYYVTDATLAAVASVAQRSMYTWGADITFNEFPNHWSRTYDVVTVANIALESISKLTPATYERDSWNNAKGSALLYRAKSFLTVVSNWARGYHKNTSTTELGIPLRTSSDYDLVTTRASLQASYDQIITDLKISVDLLPNLPQHQLRPSKAAAYGLLARTYLMMSEYDSALAYTQKYLDIKNLLLDFNTLNAAATFPVPQFNVEVVMHTIIPVPTILTNTRARIDSVLYSSYEANDLRKIIFFRNNGNGSFGYKGSYTQSQALYNGVATDEMYLVKAECLARINNLAAAMEALNQLLANRWRTGTFIPYVAGSMQEALQIILRERRKELIFRDLRWSDLKRLNQQLDFQQTIKRKVNGVEVILPPNDNRYALPIPQSVITLSGIAQNPR